MRSVQTVLVKTLLLLFLLAGLGVVVWYYPVPAVQDGLQRIAPYLPQDPVVQRQMILAAGALVALLALVGLLPLAAGRGGRRITFATSHGTVTIALRPVYRALYRVVRKMPEVRSCRLDIRHGAEGKTLLIHADARLNKMPRQRARDTARRVNDMITNAAMGLLGMDELLEVDLNVRDFTVDVNATVQHLHQDHPLEVEEPIAIEGLAMVRIDEVEMPAAPEDDEPLETFEHPVDAANLPELHVTPEESLPEVNVVHPGESAPIIFAGDEVSGDRPQKEDAFASLEEVVQEDDEALPEADVFIEAELEATPIDEPIPTVDDSDRQDDAVDVALELSTPQDEEDDLAMTEPALPPLQFDEDEAPSQDDEEKRKEEPGDPWSL